MSNSEHELFIAKSYLSKLKREAFCPTEGELEVAFNLISQHIGPENAITDKACAEITGVNARTIRKAFELLPVCTMRNGSGYFWPESEDDIYKSKRPLENQLKSIKRHVYRYEAYIRRLQRSSLQDDEIYQDAK